MTVTPTIRTSAHCGYVEAQESLTSLFGQRIEVLIGVPVFAYSVV